MGTERPTATTTANVRRAELRPGDAVEHYRSVARYLDTVVDEARRTGFVRTLFGRKREVVDIDSRNRTERWAAERIARNTPIQGTAADLMKLAMVKLFPRLREMGARMLLQVHDELVFEVPPHELNDVRAMVKREMEGVRKLNVPLVVDTGTGDNWRDAK